MQMDAECGGEPGCHGGGRDVYKRQIVGDGNLQPWNIKRGVTIFGRAGTFEGWLDRYYNIFLDGNTTGINYGGSYTNLSLIHI